MSIENSRFEVMVRRREEVVDWMSLLLLLFAEVEVEVEGCGWEVLVGIEVEVEEDCFSVCRREACVASARRSGEMVAGSGGVAAVARGGSRARGSEEGGGRRRFSQVWRSVWSLCVFFKRIG